MYWNQYSVSPCKSYEREPEVSEALSHTFNGRACARLRVSRGRGVAVRPKRRKTTKKPTKKRDSIAVEELERTGVPRVFWEVSATEYTGPSKVRKAIRLYQRDLLKHEKGAKGLFLVGEDDVTITMLIACVIKRALAVWRTGRIISLEDLAQRVKDSGWSCFPEFAEYDFLAIDPLYMGDETVPPFIVKVVLKILLDRRKRGKPTIIGSTIPLYVEDTDNGEFSVESVFGNRIATLIERNAIEIHCPSEEIKREIVR